MSSMKGIISIFTLLLILWFPLFIYAQEPRVYTEEDLKKYQYSNHPSTKQKNSCTSKASTDYIMCIFKKIDKTCGYLANFKKTKDELLAIFKECDSLMHEIDADKDIPHDIKIMMMNEITKDVEDLGILLEKQ